MKQTEKRAARWRARWGHEQTEIDALAALRPETLRDIAVDAISRFYDAGLAKRVETARDEYLAEAEDRIREHPRHEELQQAVLATNAAIGNAVRGPEQRLSEAIRQVLSGMQPELQRAHEQVALAFQEFQTRHEQIRRELDEIELPAIELPEPEIDKGSQPVPLFTTDDDFVTATRKLVADKALDDTPDED